NRRREVAVDRKIVPFEHVTDHARGDHSACLRGIHLTPTRRDFASINIALAECTKRSRGRSISHAAHFDRERRSRIYRTTLVSSTPARPATPPLPTMVPRGRWYRGLLQHEHSRQRNHQ